MQIDLLTKTEVLFRGRKAILTGYFDAALLLFDKREKKPKWDDLRLIDDYYPKNYVLFVTNIPFPERMEILLPDGSPLLDCCCESLLFTQDLPRTVCEAGHIELIGEDPFDYRETGEGYIFNRPDVWAQAVCKHCGKRYRVHFHDGYRVTYPKWERDGA